MMKTDVHNAWKEDKIRIAIHAHTFGCLGVHRCTSGEGYKISHIGTGYAIPDQGKPFPEDKVSCEKMAEDLVNEIPELDDFFTSNVDGTANKKQREKIIPKIFEIAQRHSS